MGGVKQSGLAGSRAARSKCSHQLHSLGVKVIDMDAALAACSMAGEHLVVSLM